MVLPHFLSRYKDLEDFKIVGPLDDNFSLTVPSQNVNNQTCGDSKSSKK
jgi:hypothetical protein